MTDIPDSIYAHFVGETLEAGIFAANSLHNLFKFFVIIMKRELLTCGYIQLKEWNKVL